MRRSGQALCIVFLGLCTTSTAERPHFDLPDVLQVKNDLQPGPSGIVTGGVVIADDDPRTLELCECEPAQGSPNGLSCQKEGWFISNFQQAGQWLNGGGLVPLSHAVCCRPCLPKELPGSTANDSSAVAIVSLGCHASSNPGSASLRCESSGGSFITGWSEAVKVPNSDQYYYPVGAVDCCTPSLLLSNGEARELERCQCVEENDINCGGLNSHRLVAGYMHWGISQTGEFVPIAPALCCRSCISDKVIPTDTCFDLNYCSGHGVCTLGACECAEGFGGADCKHKVTVQGGGLPQWLISIIIVASCISFSVFVIVVSKIVRFYTIQHNAEGDESSEGEQLMEPLIIGLASDDDGSVGSIDSSDADEDDANMPPPISRRPQPEEEQAVGGGVPVQPAEAQAAPRTEPFEISHDPAERQPEVRQAEPSEEEQNAARIQADEVVIEDIRRAEAVHSSRASGSLDDQPVADLKDEVEEPAAKEQKERCGVPGMECSVCFNRPVQVTVVPCGHMCMCRRCSRRLQTCPVCRTRIIRRQRVFVGG